MCSPYCAPTCAQCVSVQRASGVQPVDCCASSESCCWLMSLWMPRKWSPVECADLCPLPNAATVSRWCCCTTVEIQSTVRRVSASPPPPSNWAHYWQINTKKSFFLHLDERRLSRLRYCWLPFHRLVWLLSCSCCLNSVTLAMLPASSGGGGGYF